LGLNSIDWVIIALYLAGITAFGLRFRSRNRSLKDYFLADRNIPWWAIALSIVAAETSTLTIISIPGIAYDSNFGFLQVVFGYVLGRIIIAVIFIPHYFRGDLFTAYQLIERRFGPRLRSLTAGLFLITRSAAEGVRVFAVAIVVKIALSAAFVGLSDWQRDVAAIAIVTALTLVYTFEGGMTAVIWTDVVQLFIYLGGTMVGFFTILHLVPGGWGAVHQIAAASNKFRIFDFTPDFFRTYTFWAGLIGGAFLTTASHGTDQLIVQRLLAARGERQSKLALLSSGAMVLVQFAIFLLVGAMLFAFYKLFPPAAPFAKTDYIFPTFITTHLPHGVSGLLIAAILAAAMSNLSAALNSLSSTAVIDFYLRRYPDTSERRRVLISRFMTIAWGLLLFALAILSRRGGKVVEVGLALASVAYGALLGVFLLGVLTRRANESGGMVAMLCGFLLNLYLWQGRAALGWMEVHSGVRWTVLALSRDVPWTWYVAIGSLATFAIGYFASIAFEERGEAARGKSQHA
jgi:SSS family solute:Na+ symporter